MSCNLLIVLSSGVLFRPITKLTLKVGSRRFLTLLKHVAESFPVLSYLDIYCIAREGNANPPLSVKAVEAEVALGNFCSLRADIGLLKYFRQCKSITTLGLKCGILGLNPVTLDEALRAFMPVFKYLWLMKLSEWLCEHAKLS